MTSRETRVLIDDMMYPEGPRWHDGRFFVADFYAHEVVAVDLDGNKERVVEVPEQPSGMGWLPDGRLLVVSMLDAKLLVFDGRELSTVADLSDTTPHANDMVVDERGRAYVGGMPLVYGDRPEIVDDHNAGLMPEGTQSVYLVDAGSGVPATTRVVASGIDFPNGCVITPDGRTLILAESMGMRLSAFDIADDGSLSNRRVWAELGRVPDGIALDAENHIWYSVPGPASERGLYRVAEGGEVKEHIRTEWSAMACIFGGPQNDHLCFVEAKISGTGSAPELRKRGNGRTSVVRVDVPGAGRP